MSVIIGLGEMKRFTLFLEDIHDGRDASLDFLKEVTELFSTESPLGVEKVLDINTVNQKSLDELITQREFNKSTVCVWNIHAVERMLERQQHANSILQKMCSRNSMLREFCERAIRAIVGTAFERYVSCEEDLEYFLRANEVQHEVIALYESYSDEEISFFLSSLNVEDTNGYPEVTKLYAVDAFEAIDLLGEHKAFVCNGKALFSIRDAQEWLCSRWKDTVERYRTKDLVEVTCKHALHWIKRNLSRWNELLSLYRSVRKRKDLTLEDFQSAKRQFWKGSFSSDKWSNDDDRSDGNFSTPSLRDPWMFVDPTLSMKQDAALVNHVGEDRIDDLLSIGSKQCKRDTRAKSIQERLVERVFSRSVEFWSAVERNQRLLLDEPRQTDSFRTHACETDRERAHLERLKRSLEIRAEYIREKELSDAPPSSSSSSSSYLFTKEQRTLISHYGVDVRFTREYWQLLPPCISGVLFRAFEEQRHLYDKERMFVFQFLAYVRVPLDVSQELWYELCLRSKHATYTKELYPNHRTFAENNTTHGQYPHNLYETRTKRERNERLKRRREESNSLDSSSFLRSHSAGYVNSFLSCKTVRERSNGEWCPFSSTSSGIGDIEDLASVQKQCKVDFYRQSRREINILNGSNREDKTLEDGLEWPNKKYWSPGSAHKSKLYMESKRLRSFIV